MEELKQLMISRITFINSFKNKISPLLKQKSQHPQLMQQLLAQKKKNHSKQSSEIKISRTLIAQKIQSPYKLMQFYESSKLIMKSYSSDFLSQSDSQQISKLVTKNKKNQSQNQSNNPNLSDLNQQKDQIFKPEKHLFANIQNKKKLILRIIRLYYEFFMAQNSESKAQEIMHIYKKKLCQQSQIAPTLFCWLNDWIAKQFVNFIKTQMNDLNLMKNDQKVKRNNNKLPISQSQVQQKKQPQNVSKKTIFQVSSYQTSNKKFKRLNKSNQVDMFFSIDLDSGRSISEQKNDNLSVKQINNLNDQNFLRPRNNLSLGNPQIFLTIERSKQISPKIQYKDTSKGRRYYSSDTSNLIAYQKMQRNDDMIHKQFNFNEGDSFPINRQIFIGAYYEKYHGYYKNLQAIIPDLDIQYIKQIKRNDRKAQLKKRMKQVTRMFIRTQPLIKASIDDYTLYYKEKTHRVNKLISKIQKSHHKKTKQIDGYQNTALKTYENSQEKKFRVSVKSQRDIPSNLFDKNQTQTVQVSTIIQQSFSKKKQEKIKETLSLNRPIQFQFNLPRIPDHQKGVQLRPKEQSKIVLIQSGRYKVIDSPKLSQTLQLTSRKNNHQQLSIDMSDNRQKNKSLIIESQRHINKTPEKADQRSTSILQMITKKKKKTFSRYKKNVSDYKNMNIYEENEQNARTIVIKSPKISQKYDYQVPKQIVEVISNLESSDFYTLSGWQKGQETPVIS